MTCWGSYHHIPHVILISTIAILQILPSKKKEKVDSDSSKTDNKKKN
jgi:hypothetical protein